MHDVDFRTLALKQAQVPGNDLAKLREVLTPSRTQSLASRYERSWGAIDYGTEWEITLGHLVKVRAKRQLP